MAVKLIANTVWQNAARVVTHTASDFTQISADVSAGLMNIVNGPRHLQFTAGDNALRRASYINANGGLSCDTIILVRADYHSGEQVRVYQSADPYPTAGMGSAVVTYSPFSETLIGPNSQDWVYETSLSSKFAIGLEFTNTTYAKKIGKLIAGNSITFSYAAASYRPNYSEVILNRQKYLVEHDAAFVFSNVSRATVQSLETLYQAQKEPVFFYNSDGYTIPDKLWHGVITDIKVKPMFDDLNIVEVLTSRLRHY